MALKGEVLDKMAALITAAFGLVAALGWNGAIRAKFAEVFGDPDTVPAMLAYAILVTMLAVVVTIWVARTVAKTKTEPKK